MLPSLHAAVLAKTIEVLREDSRFEALLGGGSLVHGGFDDYSDLDLVLVVRAADYAEVMDARRAIAAKVGGLLSAFTGQHVGEPRLLICLFGPPLLHVDLKFVRLDDLDIMVERPRLLWARDPSGVESRLDSARIHWPDHDPQWFEDRAWIWLHYCAAKLLRGEIMEANGMLAFFRDQVLGPMFHRRGGRPQRGVRRIEQDSLASAALAATAAAVDIAAVAQALEWSIALYLELRGDAPPERLTPGMPEALRDYLQTSGRN